MIDRNLKNVGIFVDMMREGKLTYCDGYLFRHWDRKSGWLGSPIQLGSKPGASYVQICSRFDGELKAAYIHRVIWAYFNGPLPPDLQINHIDGNKRNNRIENLELVTNSENQLHATRTGLRITQYGERAPGAKLTDEQALKIAGLARDRKLRFREIGRMFGVTAATVCRIGKGQRRNAVGISYEASGLARRKRA